MVAACYEYQGASFFTGVLVTVAATVGVLTVLAEPIFPIFFFSVVIMIFPLDKRGVQSMPFI